MAVRPPVRESGMYSTRPAEGEGEEEEEEEELGRGGEAAAQGRESATAPDTAPDFLAFASCLAAAFSAFSFFQALNLSAFFSSCVSSVAAATGRGGEGGREEGEGAEEGGVRSLEALRDLSLLLCNFRASRECFEEPPEGAAAAAAETATAAGEGEGD